MTTDPTRKAEQIMAAFGRETPRFEVDPQQDVFVYQGRIGVRAENRSACYDGGRCKRAYYVEGSPYEMGYLMGLMGEPQVSRMCTEYNQRFLAGFIDPGLVGSELARLITIFLKQLVTLLTYRIRPDIPTEYHREIRGVRDGCAKANPRTEVDEHELWMLNVGIDVLSSYVYTGGLPLDIDLPFDRSLIRPEHLSIPLACNGFSAFGPLVEDDGHFLGRDFMFATAGVMQDTTCLIVQNPVGKIPFVSLTAPGIIGSIAGMNLRGLGAGVDMSPAGNCDPRRPGFNSLLLVRHVVENSETCQEAVRIMEEAQRGVSWNYIVANHGDDGTDSACVVEAGCKVDVPDLASHLVTTLEEQLVDPSLSAGLPTGLTSILPDKAFLENHVAPGFQKGLMVRWNDYAYPEEYLSFNQSLFRLFNKPYDPQAFGEIGYVNPSPKDRNCPYGYYFAPQRERNPHLTIVTNMYVIPEMRLFAMHPWTNLIAHNMYDDFQWRYDALNDDLATRLSSAPGKRLALEEAKEIINFLTPDPEHGRFPDYYNPDHEDWRTIEVHGSVSLMDLKNKVIHTHYGYHGDDWVQLHLAEYITAGGILPTLEEPSNWHKPAIEGVPRCATCPIRQVAEARPRSLVGRVWSWHITWCPTWKAYQAYLAKRERTPADPAD